MPDSKPTIRCAIYTRKSTEEGLDQSFNTLDAQRDAGEAFIRSQKHEGWIAVPDSYDDGGFTGANMERPALKRLLADIATGRVNCVVVYKVDRLTRSLLDFSRIIEVFDKHGATFVSVTQQFNTTSSLGRLTLNILLSFAQFERETISERTRDKMAAARRRGKWVGGGLILGYDCAPGGGALVVNREEAERVRAIFQLYLDLGSMIPVVEELGRRGWRMKAWTTREGKAIGGASITKTTLHNLLRNVTYTGRVSYQGQNYDGEHERILDDGIWNRVQQQLSRNGRRGGRNVRNKYNALLKGIVRCGSCDAGMSHTYVQRTKEKLYRYYVCVNAHQKGWNSCETKSVSAPALEGAVVQQLRSIRRNPTLLAEVLKQVDEQARLESETLNKDRDAVAGDLARLEQDLAVAAKLVGTKGPKARDAASRLAGLHEQVAAAEARLAEVTAKHSAKTKAADPGDVEIALDRFDPLWTHMTSWEQEQFIRTVVRDVRYDGRSGTVTLGFHSAAVKELFTVPGDFINV